MIAAIAIGVVVSHPLTTLTLGIATVLLYVAATIWVWHRVWPQ